jgi:alpha-ribazole phosphatase
MDEAGNPLMHIYLIRHPPPIGTDGLCYGRLDVAVTPQAIEAAAHAVSAQIPSATIEDARVYCSPSPRCVELARRIASPREPTPAEELMEMNFGQWQGLAWGDVPREEIDAWAKDVWRYRPGGGESAEMVADRWRRWLAQLPRNDGGSVVAVTHAGVIRVALARSGQLDDNAALTAPVPFGSVHRLDFPPHRDVSAETFPEGGLSTWV